MVKIQILVASLKVVTAENIDQAVHVYGSLVRNYTASPKMLF